MTNPIAIGFLVFPIRNITVPRQGWRIAKSPVTSALARCHGSNRGVSAESIHKVFIQVALAPPAVVEPSRPRLHPFLGQAVGSGVDAHRNALRLPGARGGCPLGDSSNKTAWNPCWSQEPDNFKCRYVYIKMRYILCIRAPNATGPPKSNVDRPGIPPLGDTNQETCASADPSGAC